MCGIEFSCSPVSSFVIDFSTANGDSFPYLSSLSSFIENLSLRKSEANPLHVLSIYKKMFRNFSPLIFLYIQENILYEQRNKFSQSLNNFCHRNAIITLLFFVVGVDASVNNIDVFSFSMENQKWIPFALFSSCKIFRTAV